MVRAALDAAPAWADMQGDAFNAFNDFLRRPLFGNCHQTTRFCRYSALLRWCTAVHLRCTLTTPLMLMPRLCVSRVPVASTKVAFSKACSSQYYPLGCPKSWLRLPRKNMLFALILTMVTSWAPLHAPLMAIGEAIPAAYASVGLTVTVRKK
jgi:hypothetical protein